MSRYLIFDEETETHHSNKRKSNCFDPQNYVVMRGWKLEGQTKATAEYFKSKEDVTPLHIPDDVTILVGHNSKFDLLYEMCIPGGYENLLRFFQRGGKIWCTQYAYYLLNAQQDKAQMVAMDAIIEEYGGRKKIDGIKAMWDAGMLTSEINPDTLLDYLIGTEAEGRNSGDIGNTELIYKGQLKEAADLGMTKMIEVRMDGLLATTEMEYNGLAVDISTAKTNMKTLEEEQAEVAGRLSTHIDFIPEEVQFNWNSPIHVSCLLYGGTIRYQVQTTYIDETTGELARKKAKARWPLFRGEPKDAEAHQEWTDIGNGVSRRMRLTDDELWVVDTKDAEREHLAVVVQDRYQSGKKVGEGKFKNVDVPGELKVKYQDFFYELPQIVEPLPEWTGAHTDGRGGPVYGTGSEVLEILALKDIPFLQDYTRNSAINKELGTYYIKWDVKKKAYSGALTCYNKHDKRIHHKLNHTSTVTTRLSSSDPNMQNIPRKKKGGKVRVKEMFISRFNREYCEAHGLPIRYDADGNVKPGIMGEVDYSQLEVVGQALLSRDKNLCKDLNNKVDFHCKRVSLKNSVSYDFALFACKDESHPEYDKWSAERTGCKVFSFQRAYGAGAAKIAYSTGIPEEDVKALIAAEEKEYPAVVQFNKKVTQEINDTATRFRDPSRGFREFRRGTWQAPTGTMYSFRTYDAPAYLKKKGITDSFMPTEILNYPVQGTSGEIVQMVLGVLWRFFVKNNNWNGRAFLVNTVHDCVWFDMHPDVVDEVLPKAMRIMESVPQLLKHFFNINSPVPFPVDAEVGYNMLELHHYEQEKT